MTNIPTIQELKDTILTNIQAELGTNIPSWKKTFLKALAVVLAGVFKMLYYALGNVQKNIFVDTADPESAGGTLERFGRIKLGRNPYPATQGRYNISVTGTVGGIIPAQTQFLSDDTSKNPGKIFIVDTQFTLVSSPDVLTVRALESGVGSRLGLGDTLTATAPILNVDSAAIVDTENVIPNDGESIEAYRKTAIESFQLEPQGGSPADYRLWGKDASGVKQIYPYAASNQPNEVNVYVEATVADSTDGMGTPTSTILADVEAAVEADPITGRGRRPVGVFKVNTMPVVVNKISIQITGYQGLTPAKEATILQGLSEAISNIRPFIGGADIIANRNDVLSNNNIINIILSTIPGSLFTSVEMKVQIGMGPQVVESTKVFDNGNIPYLVAVTYV
ncbi:MAG: baseplate J/gp47 family protein [Taibaiella sp.]|jgi:uncharacterized phage protein gp47/JayE